jgi:hypothetical protein
MKSLSQVLLALAVVVGAAACGDSTSPSGSGLTRVYLKDAPFPIGDVKSVEIYVVSVAVSPSGDTLMNDWITVAEPRKRFDLLTLQGGTTALLGEKELPAGAYQEVRFVMNTDSSSIVWADGHPATVHWGDPGEISLHPLVQQPMGIPAEGSHLVVDFNVAQTFPYNLIPGYEFDFLPTIQVTVEPAGP